MRNGNGKLETIFFSFSCNLFPLSLSCSLGSQYSTHYRADTPPIYVLPLRRKTKDESHKTKDKVELLYSPTYVLVFTRMEDRIFCTKQQQEFSEFSLFLTYSWITILFVTIIQELKTDLQLICYVLYSLVHVDSEPSRNKRGFFINSMELTQLKNSAALRAQEPPTPHPRQSLCSARPILSISHHPSGVFPSCFPTKILNAFFFSPLVLHVLLISPSLTSSF